MNFKKWLTFLLTVILLLPALALPAAAAGDPVLRYELTIDGRDIKEAEEGDIVTVTLHLRRVDKNEPYTMYAMQSEIRYDSNVFRLVEDSWQLYNGVQSTDIAMVDHFREFYMNFVSFSGGTEWPARTRVGSFELEVIGTKGVSQITNEDYLVSKPNGSGGYECESNVLTVVLTSECVVHFETNGGSKIDDVKVSYGEKLSRPKDPTREDKTFAGWFKDIHLTDEWDFKNDTVQGNMTLYAKWEEKSTNTGSSSVVVTPGTDTPSDPDKDDPSVKPTDPSTDPSEGDDPIVKPEDEPSVNAPTEDDPAQKPEEPSGDDPSSNTPAGPDDEPSGGGKGGQRLVVFLFPLLLLLILLWLLRGKRTVKFNACGGSPVEKQKLKKGSLVEEPVAPAKPGVVFDGWYLDPELTLPWNFEESIVRKNITLYAKWK